jgi:hypothetical protein
MDAAQTSSHDRRVGAVARVSLLLAAVVVLVLIGAGSSFAISRDTVLARAQAWVDHPVPYSQAKHHGGYRTDCSGFVSMCWATGTSWSTRSFHVVTRRIRADQLMPGDALLHAGHHIQLFYGWVDDARTTYVCYEQTGPSTKSSIKSIAEDVARGFVPTRYDHIAGSPASRNLLRNGSFDVWAHSWGDPAGQPVWWDTGERVWQQPSPVVHRQDVYRSARNSLELTNPSPDPRAVTQISQTVTITAETTYTLSAWAKTADPAGLEMRISYLDGTGRPLAGSRTTGDAYGVDDSAFKQMAALVVTPSDAARAIVTLQLGGGSSVVGTATVPGTSAVLDSIALVRPHATIGIKTSAATSRIGRTVTLSGSVTPTASIGATIAVSVQAPGKGWTAVPSPTVSASGGSAVWRSTYVFKRGMRTGVYRFKATAPAFGSWLGADSSVVSVRVR